MKPEFKPGQIWEYDDGGEFTVKIIKVNPMWVMCLNKGDSNWEVGEVDRIHVPGHLRRAASVIFRFTDYYKQIKL